MFCFLMFLCSANPPKIPPTFMFTDLTRHPRGTTERFATLATWPRRRIILAAQLACLDPCHKHPAIVSHRFSIQPAMVGRFSTARLVGDSGMAKDGNVGAGSGGPVSVFSVVCKDID
jgi:hypothetical protein